MLTTLLLLASAIPAPLPHACESAAVELPGLTLAAPPWGFVVRPETACSASVGVEALEYALGIDAAAPVESEERADLAIYAEDLP